MKVLSLILLMSAIFYYSKRGEHIVVLSFCALLLVLLTI